MPGTTAAVARPGEVPGGHLRWRRAAPLTLVVVLATALRAAWALHAARPPVGLHDPTFYVFFGDRLAAGDGYVFLDGLPTAYYPVGYPAALGALFWLADRTPLPDDRVALVVLLGLVASAASVVLVHELGRRLFDRRVGLLAAAGFALLPNLVLHAPLALTETLFGVLALGAVLVVVATRWDRRPAWALAAFGALTGLAALVRPPSLLFVPVLVVAGLVACRWPWREALRVLAIAGLAATAVVAPWTVRNVVVMGAPILISSNLGDNLLIGNGPDATGAFMLPPPCRNACDEVPRPEAEVRKDADARAQALEAIADDPGAQLRLVPTRLWRTFREDTDGLAATESYGEDRFLDDGFRDALVVASNVAWWPVLVLGLAAVPALGRRSRSAPRDAGRTFVVLAAASLAATPLLFFGDPRFKVPVVPLLLLGAAAVVVALADRVRRRPSPAG